MSGNRKSKKLIAAILCMAMTGSILAYLPNEVSAQTSTEVENGSFEVGYAGMDVYGWHLTAMADELSEGVQTDANATVQSLEAYTLKMEAVAEGTDRSKVAALTKYGKGTVAMTSQTFGITGGESYTISCDVALKDWTPTAPGIQVAVKEMADDGTLVKWTIPTTDGTDAGDMTTDNVVTTYPTTEWTTITRTFAANENTTKAELYIWVGADDSMTGTVLFDKVAVSASEIETETTPENPISSMLEGGDANYDSESNTSGSIDICDVIHMKKYLADEEVVVSDSADMNRNQIVNEDDLTLLRWKLLGATTTAAAEQVGIRTDLSNQLTVQAQTLIDSIYALPAVSKLQGFSGSPIEIADLEFAKLNGQIKAKVSNRKTLATLESAYNENYKMLYSMSDTSAFSIHSSYIYDGITLNDTPGVDATYGNVLTVTRTEATGTRHIVLGYEKENDLLEQLSGYENVCFYVYNAHSNAKTLMCNWGNGLNTEYMTLNAEAWTKVEVPVADFSNGKYFGIFDIGGGTGTLEFKFSAIWAEKDHSAEEAQPVIDMIDALPKTTELEGYHQAKIAEVRAAYDTLRDVAKEKVSNYETLTALETAYNANYKMLYGMSDISAFTINDNYPGYQYYALTAGTDATYGNVLKASYARETSGDSHIVIKYAKSDDLATQLSGYDKVCFYVYNGHSSTKNLLCNFGGNGLKTDYLTLNAEAWTKVEVPVADFVSGTQFGLYDIGTGTYEFQFSPIWAESYLKLAQPVIDMIDALPTATELEGYHQAEIAEVRAAYDALSDVAKEKVSNYASLTALESAYAANYKMLYDMSDVSIFTKNSNYPGYDCFTLASGTDATYGDVLKASYVRETSGDSHIVIKYAKSDDLATQLSGYDKVCFYVYNGHSTTKNLLCNFGGSLKTNYLALNAEAWTKVEVPVADFVSGTYFGIYDVGIGTYEFQFSPIWAEKANSATEAQPVIDMIDALPTVTELEGYHQAKITEVRAAYDALSDGAKEKVSNYATLTALESAYVANYKMLYGISDISPFTKHDGYAGYQYFTLTSGTDATYGNVLNATYANESTGEYHLVIKYTKPTDLEAQLSGYEKVCFYVYNGRSDTRKLMCNFGGSLKTDYMTLNAGAWTKVEVSVADFISGTYFGIYSVGYKTGTQEFQFSPIWAEKAQ